jgi:hypothetical protein
MVDALREIRGMDPLYGGAATAKKKEQKKHEDPANPQSRSGPS